MSKISLIYWSGSGNTEEMANAIKEGLTNNSADFSFFEASDVDKAAVKDSEIFIFGSPACGTEQINEDYMEPLMEDLAEDLNAKKVFLFGSFGWGGGEFMDNWKEQLDGFNVEYIADPILAETTPDDDVLTACREIGEEIAAL